MTEDDKYLVWVLGHFLCEENEQARLDAYAVMRESPDDDQAMDYATVWEPFETDSVSTVCENIDNMLDDVKQTFVFKPEEKEVECKFTYRGEGSDAVQVCNSSGTHIGVIAIKYPQRQWQFIPHGLIYSSTEPTHASFDDARYALEKNAI